MSPDGVITMITTDGDVYTADVGSMIKTNTLANTSEITWSVSTDEDGNKTWTPAIVDGGITASKLQPNFLADCQSAKQDAQTASTTAVSKASDSEAYACGTREGQPVAESDPAYHNNAKYYKDMANPSLLSALTDTDINNPAEGEALVFDGENWVNESVDVPIATTSAAGAVKPDGETITVDADGTIHGPAVATVNTGTTATGKKQGVVINGSTISTQRMMSQEVTASTTEETTATFEWEEITESSAIDVYTSVYGIVPSDVVTTAGECTVTLPTLPEAETITVAIYLR